MTLALVALALAACFGAPEPVTIRGYDGHAMEPFISRDGATLFFNSRNGPRDQTDIYWARRINDTTFDFAGPLAGANSDKLDGVPTLSLDGAFAMISVRAVAEQGATVWTGAWDGRVVHGLALQRVLSPGPLPLFNMDIEMSADGRRLYFTDNRWSPFGPPSTSDFHLAVRENGAWRRAPEFDSWFDRIMGSREIVRRLRRCNRAPRGVPALARIHRPVPSASPGLERGRFPLLLALRGARGRLHADGRRAHGEDPARDGAVREDRSQHHRRESHLADSRDAQLA